MSLYSDRLKTPDPGKKVQGKAGEQGGTSKEPVGAALIETI